MKKKRKNSNSRSYICLTGPFGYAIGLAVLFFILMVTLAELAARTHTVQSFLPTPILGSGSKHLDLKFSRLTALVKEEPVDCILIGGSAVNRGIDPVLFEQSYKKQTGRTLRCFNFGVNGLNMSSVSVLLKILFNIYKPKFFIVGRLPYTEDQGILGENEIILNTWIRYHLGFFTVEGCLMNYSHAYRYYLRFRTWLEKPEYSNKLKKVDGETSPYGFGFSSVVREDIHSLLNDNPKWTEKWKNRLADFKVSPKQLTALENLLEFRSKVELVFLEMPVHPVFTTLYGKGPSEHYQYVSEIGNRLKERDVLFFPTTHLNLILDKGWKNCIHMNHIGAKAFSKWLGDKIGEAVNQGQIEIPVRNTLNGNTKKRIL